jgi:hypothetical protein
MHEACCSSPQCFGLNNEFGLNNKFMLVASNLIPIRKLPRRIQGHLGKPKIDLMPNLTQRYFPATLTKLF